MPFRITLDIRLPHAGETGTPKCPNRTCLPTTIDRSPQFHRMTVLSTPSTLPPVTRDATITYTFRIISVPLLPLNNYTPRLTDPPSHLSNGGYTLTNNYHQSPHHQNRKLYQQPNYDLSDNWHKPYNPPDVNQWSLGWCPNHQSCKLSSHLKKCELPFHCWAQPTMERSSTGNDRVRRPCFMHSGTEPQLDW